jgi:hypothetical protein
VDIVPREDVKLEGGAGGGDDDAPGSSGGGGAAAGGDLSAGAATYGQLPQGLFMLPPGMMPPPGAAGAAGMGYRQ